MRIRVEQRVRSFLRITLVMAIAALASSSTVALAQANFREVLSRILAERKTRTASGVESVVAKMLEEREAKAVRRLDVWQCMSLALDQNKEIREAWHLLQQTRVGDRMIARSRLFPQLELLVNRIERDNETTGVDFSDTQTSLKLSQRILEFGKDAPVEVALRASQRSALYNLESTVRRVLAGVRQNFYEIILRDEQIKTRMELLGEFMLDWEKKKERFKERGPEAWREPRVEPSTVLQAEANVMNELGSINSLLRNQASLKIELLQRMGEPIGQNIELEGEQDETMFDVEDAVGEALENSIEIARLEEEVEEQKRVLRQLLWEFAPDVNLQTGVSRRGEDASLSVSNSGDTWAVDATGERFIEPGDARNERFDLSDQEDFFLDLEVRVPILEGFARVGRVRRERERLKQAEARLQRAGELAELDVRKSYEQLLAIAMDVQLQAQQTEISRHLFDIQNELRDKLPAMVSEESFEVFRNRFFNDQDRLFSRQAGFIQARENLRESMGLFE